MFQPPDSAEWTMVVNELADFLRADNLMDVVGAEARAKPLALRVSTEPAAGPLRVELQHAVLAGAHALSIGPTIETYYYCIAPPETWLFFLIIIAC